MAKNETKMFGLCCLDHDGKIKYLNFDEACLIEWITDNGKEVSLKRIRDLRPGQTCSFLEKQGFIFWRQIPGPK